MLSLGVGKIRKREIRQDYLYSYLLLASQELGNEIDKGMLGNLGTRLCLGCLAKTSEQILGNDEAKTNFGQKGRLIINNNPAVGSVEENVNLRTPFLPDVKIGSNRTIFDYMGFLHDLGKASKKSPYYNISFYDEQRFDFEVDFLEYIRSRVHPKFLYLGEPSFVLHNPDGEKWLRIELITDSNQNILIFSPLKQNRQKFLAMMLYNFIAMQRVYPEIGHTVIYADRLLYESLEFSKLQNKQVHYLKEYTNPLYGNIRSAMWRKLMIECDEKAFGPVTPSPESETLLEMISKDSDLSGELWLKRAHCILELLKMQSYINAFGMKGLSGDSLKNQTEMVTIQALLTMKSLKNNFEKIVLDTFPPKFIWILGMESTLGLGVDSRSPNVEDLKSVLRESSEYNVFFIVSAATMEDTSTMRVVFTHVLCSDLQGSHQNQIKTGDEYPDTCADILGIYFNSSWESNKCRKFKKMKFEEEI